MSKLTLAAVFTAGLIATVSLGGCSKTESGTTASKQAVTVSDQWVKAADSGMTAAFVTLKNPGPQEVTVVSATSPAAGRVEMHEVVSQPGGGSVMQPKAGGFSISAGGTHELAPGADHLMLMDLKSPLAAGADVEITLTFKDGSSLPFTAQVRTFPGAGENYAPGGHAAGQHG